MPRLRQRSEEPQVVVMDKGKIERSGNIAGGVDHFLAYLETGEPWDSREAYLGFVQEEAYGIVNLEIHNRVFCDELKSAISRLERIGSPLSDARTGPVLSNGLHGSAGSLLDQFQRQDTSNRILRERCGAWVVRSSTGSW